ncbi:MULTISPECIES: hypothetical protein [unclassified Helicobacter]|uniref:hypothetical protein n=1 Tax=unclassified Helicobacter TaxID=2593540 RepID=UPI000CF12EFD|nr:MULTISPECIES: hypothetical protein [unclassified Helicobacter]
MACKFCPKIKKYDFFFIIFVCLAVWGFDKYRSYNVEKQQQKEAEYFKELQKKCLFGDNNACREAYGNKE